MRWHDSWVSPELYADIQATLRLLELVKPNIVIGLGFLALFALTGKTSVKKWRGSQLTCGKDGTTQFIPTYSPRQMQRDYSIRTVVTQDLRRAARLSANPVCPLPSVDLRVRPTFGQALEYIKRLADKVHARPTRISVDIETRAGHMACIGFATDKRSAFCIPLMCVERPTGYWSLTEETVIIQRLSAIMTHPNALCFGQNFIYDIQYIYRFWFIIPNTWFDTLNAQHIMFPGTPKSLDYLASLYCEHYVYWKDDGKDWDPSVGEDQLWVYNCEDCIRTYEVMEAQWPAIAQLGLSLVWDFQQNKLFPLLLKAMIRGIRADTANKMMLSFKLMLEISARDSWLTEVLEHPINIKSPKQMLELFVDDFKMKPVMNRVTGRPTMDDKALSLMSSREPLLKGVVQKVQELRSLNVFKSTFVEARLDSDMRLRSSYNIAGTDTFRLSSSQNAFNSGMNFQNIPSGSDEHDDPDTLTLPNIRELFLPDPGYTIFDIDLKSADFYTVVWEADDDAFRAILAEGGDIHSFNAKDLFNLSCGMGEVKKLFNSKRQLAKIWCHATNYGAGAANMARACGITQHEAERLRSRWFQMHPGIREWHERTEAELRSHRRISNRFGYRMVFFDRIDAALPVALAWRPQSQTGCIINRAWSNIDATVPEAEILIQVHDSLVGQYRTGTLDMEARLLKACEVLVPYDKPLIVPSGIKSSTVSWGACE